MLKCAKESSLSTSLPEVAETSTPQSPNLDEEELHQHSSMNYSTQYKNKAFFRGVQVYLEALATLDENMNPLSDPPSVVY